MANTRLPKSSGAASLVLALGLLTSGVGTRAIGPGLQDPEGETLRIRGQVLVESGGPLAGARIRTDALRGPRGAQFAAQREFTTRTNRSGDWSLLGLTRGLWILEVSALDHVPHVVVVPIAMMLKPASAPWDTSLSLLPVAAIAPPGTGPETPARRVIEAAQRALAGERYAAREMLQRLGEYGLDAAGLCAAGDTALLLREPVMARKFFELAASASPKWYRPHLGIASASMMILDFDRAMKGYAAARANTDNQRLERMLSSAVRELQQIRTIGGQP